MIKLPPLIYFKDYNGNWDKYLEVLYSFFQDDFINNRPVFNGNILKLKKYPLLNGKEATFWHIISEGEYEEEKIPDLRRCEHIRWPRPVVDNYPHEEIKYWENKRGAKNRICLCYGNWEYLVILDRRVDYILFWTAYPLDHAHSVKKAKKEFEEFQKKQTPPLRGGIVTPSTHGR